tara:strand:+ start:756 stop:2003 length:1248 start_codon:yes stop_codon:yes gene_type:complete
MKLGGNIFCGYYDVMCLSSDDTFLLTHKVDFIDRMPSKTDECLISIINIKSGVEEKIDVTTAWNWQQGSRLQWIGPSYNKYISYNKFINKSLCAVIYDIESSTKKIYNEPIYSVSQDGTMAVTYDFNRLARARHSYSYKMLDENIQSVESLSGKGLIVINIEKGETQQILKIEDLVENKHIFSMNYGCNWIDMPTISPDGSCIFFLHRWEIEGGFYTRLYSIDIDGANLDLIIDSGTVNHISVVDNDNVIFDGVSEKGVKNLQKYTVFNKIFRLFSPIYQKIILNRESIRQKLIKHYYYMTSKKTKISKVVARDLVSVAHPSINRVNKDLFLADTYEDENSYRNLYLCSLNTSKVAKLGRYYSPPEFNSKKYRADLHPKWNTSGDKYIVDIIENNERKVIVNSIPDNIENLYAQD